MAGDKFDQQTVQTRIKQFLDDVTKKMDSDLLGLLKQKFEAGTPHAKGPGSITANIVVDASSVNCTLNRFAEGKPGLLFKLSENPIFPLCGPPQLEAEVADYIENKAKEKYDKAKLRDGWDRLKPSIKIRQIQDQGAIARAAETMERDPTDAQFVALALDVGAPFIITGDNDFKDSIVKPLAIEEFGEVVGVYHRGLFSFVIVSETSPVVLDLSVRVIAGIARILSGLVAKIAGLVKAAAVGALDKLFDTVSKYPEWTLVGSIALLVSLAILANEKAKDKTVSLLKSGWEEIRHAIRDFLSGLADCATSLLDRLKKAGPYAEAAVTAITELSGHVEKLRKQVTEVKLSEAAGYS